MSGWPTSRCLVWCRKKLALSSVSSLVAVFLCVFVGWSFGWLTLRPPPLAARCVFPGRPRRPGWCALGCLAHHPVDEPGRLVLSRACVLWRNVSVPRACLFYFDAMRLKLANAGAAVTAHPRLGWLGCTVGGFPSHLRPHDLLRKPHLVKGE